MRPSPVFRTALRAVAFASALLFATATLHAQDAPPVPTDPDAPVAAAQLPEERDPALYRAEVELISQGDGERRAAASRALGLVLVKITGNPSAAGHPVVRRAMGQAESFVTSVDATEVSSDAEGNTAVGGSPVYKTQMAFAFDPGSVDALVAGAGLHYWPSPRPRPILWLAIDDGKGARLVNSSQLAVVKPLAARGLERGLRFGMPSGSAVEQASVQTIWAQNPAPMMALTSRYGAQTQLLGKMYRSGAGWTADWVLSRGDTELSRWSHSDASPQRAIASGADGAADALAKHDAIAFNAGAPGPLQIEIVGIAGANDYARAMGYLQSLAVVSSVNVLDAGTDTLRVQLELAVGAEGFDRFVASGTTLEADSLSIGDIKRYRLR